MNQQKMVEKKCSPNPETKKTPLTIDGWKMNFLSGCHLARGSMVHIRRLKFKFKPSNVYHRIL